MNRKEILKKLINFENSNLLDKYLEKLKDFGWDSEEEFVLLNRRHILNVLEKYLTDQITKKEVEDWANAIECREDIGRENQYESVINETIHILANPVLTDKLTNNNFVELIKNLIQQ